MRARIWQQVYGPEYPSWADPFSYVSVTELGRFARELHAARGQCLVDVGCGRGGPGLWVAAVTGARVTGIDLDEAALAAARHRADRAGIAGRASFRQGSFSDTGLPDCSAQAVMSVDALLFAPGKRAAAAELAPILVPGGRLVLTSWDYHSQPAAAPPRSPITAPCWSAASTSSATRKPRPGVTGKSEQARHYSLQPKNWPPSPAIRPHSSGQALPR